MTEGFTPRITVPDDEDAEIVFAALVEFGAAMALRYRATRAVDLEALKAARKANDLALIVGEDLQSSAVRKLFGPAPDDLSEFDQENRD